MKEIWKLILLQPLVNGLIFFYKITGNLGVAIIILSLAIIIILFPLTITSLKTVRKISEIAPEIEELRKKYKNDKQKFNQAQMDLYRQKGVNPGVGCLPQIIQFLFLFTLYQVFSRVLVADGVEAISKINEILYPSLRFSPGESFNFSFLYLNLSKPDIFWVKGVPIPGAFLILAALAQFFSSKMMKPAVLKEKEVAQKTNEKTDDVFSSMQSQTLYLFPLMTIFFGFAFPSGFILYWFVFSLSQLLQQYFAFGLKDFSFWGKIGIGKWRKTKRN